MPDAPAPSAPSGGDMPSDEFRRWGTDAVEWIASYLDEVGDYPVLAQTPPGHLRQTLPAHAPEEGEEMGRILEDFRTVVLPGVTHWNHPSFFAYFAVTGSGPGILGELLSAALNVNAMVWRSSPAATELEEHVADWIRELVGLPPGFGGVIQDTASTSSLVALATARHRAWPEVRDEGLFGLPRGRIYASEEAHSSIEKAVIALALGRQGIRKIPADREFRMRPDALREAVEEDVAVGVRPVAVVATVGTTSTSSADPVDAIGDVAREYGLWLHVDAAYAGSAAMAPEFREHFEGWGRADSVVFNPHKWLFTPVDCSLLYTRHQELVREAFSLVPEYLRTTEGDRTTNLMDYGVALGRRFRALKLWFVVRYFGAEGIRARIRHHVELARTFARWVDDEPDWVRVAPVPFSTVVFRLSPAEWSAEAADELNMSIMDEVNRGGEAFLSHTRLRGRIALRLAVGNLRTGREHVEKTWEILRDTGARIRREGRAGSAGSAPS